MFFPYFIIRESQHHGLKTDNLAEKARSNNYLKVATAFLDHDNELQVSILGDVGGSLESYIFEDHRYFGVELSHHHTEGLPNEDQVAGGGV